MKIIYTKTCIYTLFNIRLKEFINNNIFIIIYFLNYFMYSYIYILIMIMIKII